MVKFYAPDCSACKAVAPVFETVAAQAQATGVMLAEVNCVMDFDLCQALRVDGWPRIRYYRAGRFIDRYRGVNDPEALLDWITEMRDRQEL